MTRETRIALLVGLAFIVLFGLVLGQRSMNLQSQTPTLATNAGPAGPANTASTEDNRPSNELANSTIGESAHGVAPVAPPPVDAAPSRVPTAADAHVAVAPSPGHVAAPTPSAAPSPAKSDTDVAVAPASPAEGHHAIVTGAAKTDESAEKNVIDIARTDAPAGKTYTVQPGDSIFKIAKKLDLGNGGPSKIMALNKDRIKDFTAIKVGQEILVPADEAAKVTPVKAEGSKADLPAKVAEAVKKTTANDPPMAPAGKSALVALEKKPSASDVPALSPNAKPALASADKKLADDKVLVAKGTKGDVEATLSKLQDDMKVAAPGDKKADKSASLDKLDDKLNGKADGALASKTYTVRHGDSLYSIAGDQMGSHTKAAVQKLMQANGIKDPSKLTAGAELKIPKA
jgi:LysM repeat protein